MKRADLKVGMEVAEGGSYVRRVTIADLRPVERSDTWSGGWRVKPGDEDRYVNPVEHNGVKRATIRFTDKGNGVLVERDGHKMMTTLANIKWTWAEQEILNAEKLEERGRVEEAARASQRRVEALPEDLRARAPWDRQTGKIILGRVEVDLVELEQLVARLARAEA